MARPIALGDLGPWEIVWCMECKHRWIACTIYFADEVRWYGFREISPFDGHPPPFGDSK